MMTRHVFPNATSVPLARAVALAALLIASAAPPARATYSIVARDPETGQLGAAVQSHWFSVADVIWAEPGVGAIATQSLADMTYGPAGLDLLRLGRSAEKTLEGLLASDAAPGVRQVAVLDADGGIATHTGDKCIAFAGHRSGENYSVQANLMAKEGVPEAMATAFEETVGDLAERLMAALEAAQAAGGDIRGRQSAALLVTAPEPTGKPWADHVFDLRIEDHAEPVKEMRRLLGVARAYRAMNAGDEAIAEEDFERAKSEYGRAMKLAPGNPEVVFWYGVSLANAGRVDDAVKRMARVYAMDPAWRALPARLVGPGLLPDDEELIERLENAGR
jgi:uncharacterized Ntn-hydrolase superfamily protein